MDVITKLIEQNISITTAESCTGGLIASEITKVQGVSSIYSGSVVTYSNKMKNKLLGVEEEIFEHYGAVSFECVFQMCEGVQRLFDTDIAIGVSGVAGPGGGTKFSPVGTVIIGIKYKDSYIQERNIFKGDRNDIQQKAKNRALEMVEEFL